jgi:PAS domain S-box-containing protein
MLASRRGEPGAHASGLGDASRPPLVGLLLCLLGAALGVLGLCGWLTGATSLTTFVPGQPPMMPNTALGLLLLGGAGALRHRQVSAGMLRTISLLAALVVLAVGVATLAQYILGVDLHIDRLLIAVPTRQGPHAGRPSPPTAVALTCLAAALLVFDARPAARARPAEWLILLAALSAFMALLGQLFGAGPLYRTRGAHVVGVAVPTAVGLLLIAAGLLAERPHLGVMRISASRGPGGVLLRRLSLVAALAPLAFGRIIERVLPAASSPEAPIQLAALAAAMTMTGLVLLTVTAVALDRTDQVLEASRIRTRDLIEQASEGIFLADLDGRYTDVNSAGCHMLGYARDEIVGRAITELLPPSDVERLSRVKERLLRGRVDVAEWTLRRRDGSLMAVEVSAKILPDGRWQAFVRDISERKRAEERTRQAQERLELALRGADLASWDWNVKTGEVVFNARWAEMRGHRPEEVRPHVDSWISGVHPDDWPQVSKAVADCCAGVREYETEHRVRTRSGEWIWILDRGRVFGRDEEGRPVRMVGTELDITERKRVEAALRLSEARSSGILAVSADAIISVDERQRITMFNEGAEKVFGHTRAEVMGSPLEVLIPERLRARHREAVERFAASRQISRRMGEGGEEIWGLRKDGREFPADAAISTLEVGGHRLLTVALRDITEQKRIEREQTFLAEVGSVLASTLEYEDTVASIARLTVRELADLCVVDIIDESGEVRRAKVVSRDPAKTWICDLLAGMVLERRRPHPIWAVLETKRPVLLQGLPPELLASFPDQETRRALRLLDVRSVLAVPLLARGKILGAIALVSTTPAHLYGPADVRLAEELAHRAALSIENARLYSVAQQAIRAREDVLAIVAHDLRNPLGTVLLQTSVLRVQRPEPEPRMARSIAIIERAATRLDRLIQDLLAVTRIEAGRLSVERARVPTEQIVLEAVEAQMGLASSASLELQLEMAPDLPDLWADRDRLLQVFENLISNAIKFTERGGRVVVAAATRQGQVLFRVTDTGAGITAEDLPHVFDRFWQGRNARRAGAGLGLPIVKGIVEGHGGRVWIESSPGRGSTFFFTVPVARSQQRPAPAASAP